MMRIKFTPYCLPLVSAWASKHGSIRQREGWIVTITGPDGTLGFGDCAPLPEAGSESRQHAARRIQQIPAFLPEQETVHSPLLNKLRKDSPALACGLETALLDLDCRRNGEVLARRLNSKASAQVEVNAALGALATVSDEQVLRASKAGVRTLKFKIGIESQEKELNKLEKICRLLSSSQRLRLDANQAWDPGSAHRFINSLQGLPVESIEEPLRNPDPEEMAKLQAQTPIPIALDESLVKAMDPASALRRAARRLVIKPMVLGGIMPAWSIVQDAHANGQECIVTTTLDSAVGVWATAQLAAAAAPLFPGLAHGLATSSWLQKDLAQPPRIRNGRLFLGNNPAPLDLPEDYR